MIPTKQDLLDQVARKLSVAERFVNQPDTEPTEDDLWTALAALELAKKAVADILNNEYIG